MPFFGYYRSNKQSRTSSVGDDPDGSLEGPSLTKFFADAALYKQAIDNPERGSFYRASENETILDFAELVGNQLDSPERDLAGRFARLSVEDSTWFPDGKKVLADEPEEYVEEKVTAEEQVPAQAEQEELSQANQDKIAETSLCVKPGDTSSSGLSAMAVVELLIQEHGALAPEGEEKLILETDAALVLDVIIVGVLHVTTHRIAFHASLLDGNRANDVLMADVDRMRPLRSILLSSIKEIRAEDPLEPTVVRAVFEQGLSVLGHEAYIEFDTVESARDWRREMTGAVFIYKRSLQSTLQGVEDDTDGVRISIPLQAVENYSVSKYMDTLHTITISLCTTPGDENDSSDNDHSLQSVEFVAISADQYQSGLDAMIAAQQALVNKEDAYSANRKVIVDYGSLGFPQPTEHSEQSPSRSREQVVCDAIGIGASLDVWMTQASIHSSTICSGYFVVTSEWVGFWSKSLALKDQRYRISVSTIQSATAASSSSAGILSMPNLHITPTTYHLILDIQGNPSLRFQFKSAQDRDKAEQLIKEYAARAAAGSGAQTPTSEIDDTTAPSAPSQSAKFSTSSPVHASSLAASLSADSSSTSISTASDKLSPPTSPSTSRILAPLSRVITLTRKKALDMTPQTALKLPKAINIPRRTLMPIPSTHFVCLTIGSRGDVQPYIALGLGLMYHGHKVTIVTHEEYKEWIEGFGITHRTAGGDPGILMKLSVENKMFSPQFLKEGISNYRKWLDQLLKDAWEQCQDAKVLLESPYAMGGVHIAEALNIPYFRVCTMPWTKTTQFPHPFISPPVETPKFNSMSYVLFDNIFWAATSTQINRWRGQYLHLPPTDMSHLAQSKIPMIYNFSPSVVPKPLDWNDTCIETGYWFLDNPDGFSWTPPDSLVSFMSRARTDGKPLVYIGFGSITVPNPHSVTEKVYAAVMKSDVRAIISKGWSARMAKNTEKEIEMPKECYVIDKIPHDWLFPQVDAALHHGGAGTTSASLRAGIPTLIKPWFGDQYFWASRVHKLGAGMRVPSLRVSDLSSALIRATTDRRIMKEKAMIVGEKIRSEDGVHAAIRFISIYMSTAVRNTVVVS
ncbi:hypothetical protein EUX98_g4134 [Antrodiella citrinella]|uniref:sterol 3beta-glucosyltransferase n=1 Tax=Antrodiella citrinella TaxID=2447956 RepID=A0A4S4MUR1_9APHY|nr:hypothetical protein EUX98_g4134 [Antrodiella citrinella]